MKKIFLCTFLVLSVTLSACSFREDKTVESKPEPKNSSEAEYFESEIPESPIDKIFFLTDHARVPYGFVTSTNGDIPSDYYEVAVPYESFTYMNGVKVMQQSSYANSINPGVYTEIWGYDEAGNVCSYEDHTGLWKYEYDNAHNLTAEYEYDFENLISIKIYEGYDEYGNYGHEHSLRGRSLQLDGSNLDKADNISDTYYSYEYDEQGRMIIKLSSQHSNFSKSSKYYYEYDALNNIVLERDGFGTTQREFNNAGKMLSEQKYSYDGQLEESLSYTYDTHGNTISYSKNGVLIETYKNEYDEYGNLVRQYTYDAEGVCKYYDIWRYWDEETLNYMNKHMAYD